MESFWTSKKPIIGLRHFILLNNIKEKGQKMFLMVSVVDCEINFKITYEELFNSGNWEKGWINLPKNEAINEDYVRFKSFKKKEVNKIFLTENSSFNIP